MRIRTVELDQHIGSRVSVAGWLHNVRSLGRLTFIIVRDGWGVVQIVAETAAQAQPVADCALGTVVTVSGDVVAAAETSAGLEIKRPHFTIVSAAAAAPITLHKRELRLSQPLLLDNAVVANRHPKRQALLRLSAAVMRGFRQTLDRLHFTEIQSPKIVASATESGANLFAIDYFGRSAYLAQSPQFYKQIMVGVFERVYEVGPVFRAEPHETSRHLSEYVSLDVEFGFIEDHQDVMRMANAVIAGILQTLQQEQAVELALLNVTLPQLPPTIPQIDFYAAQQLIWQQHAVDVRGERDLSPQDERWLGEWALQQHGSDFLFVTGYPMAKRPFYTEPQPANPAQSNSFDLLFRGLELATGGQRRHRYQDYLSALAQQQLDVAPFAAYLQAFKHGMPPHGGFAIGLERLLMQLVGLSNVKLAALFARDIGRLDP